MADKLYKLTLSLSDGSIIDAGIITAPQGPIGANGVTFTPSVSAAGVLSWTNNGGLANPSPISIKGPKGDDAVITESDVAGWGFTKNAGTITGIKMNGVSKGTSGVVDLGTVLTAHQDISGLMPKSGGVFTGQVSIGQGDANCLYLGEDGRLNGPSNRTLFGLISGATTFGHTAYALKFRGSGTRPTFNNNEIALKSDIHDISGKANLSGNNEFVDSVNTFKGIGGTTQISGSSVWLQAVGAQGSVSLVVETDNKNEVFKVEADSDNGIIYINRAISIEGDTGTSGQVLTSQGTGKAPIWSNIPTFSLSGTTLTITV